MTKRVQHISQPDLELRAAAEAGLDRGEPYSAWAPKFQCLSELEIIHSPLDPEPPETLRIGAWNLERGTRWEAAQQCIKTAALDVVLLTEMDCGMSRSEQQHTARALCESLGWHGVFAVEFIELGLGNPWELNQPRDDFNLAGLHGNAIISRFPLRQPKLLRDPISDGSWWHRRFHEARLGGRMSISVDIQMQSGPVTCIAVHLENNCAPDDRARAIETLLDWLGDSDQACVVGGDFNTSTIDPTEVDDPFRLRTRLGAEDPERFVHPQAFEPLFEVFADANFHWGTANATGVTQRPRERGYPKPPLGHIDWLFTRHLQATAPRIVSAVDDQGLTISDHELIVATLTIN